MTTGRFIVLEGGEGAGKSSVQRTLGERLRADGVDVVETREPGGTTLGERIRELVLAQRALDDPMAELLLFEAARVHLVATVVRPALERGALVLCDRFAASSIAYQGYGRGLGREIVERTNSIATGGLTPDLTLLLDLSADSGLARRAREGSSNHFDAADLAFHERVRAGFLELARESRATWRVIDASQPLEAVVDAAYAEIVVTEAAK
jgi:dTMP kinase